jgi:hypothetical protein
MEGGGKKAERRVKSRGGRGRGRIGSERELEKEVYIKKSYR